ncbi:hypothetical protein [Nocardia sp. NBC_01327]|uniref:hypothetical protein n=1 Tax=Nocardia sp. NBC_01327 TaxID=2903593 RepID=UPI002E1650B6|nr:hypothetical protein OG326_10395 [Nocardia sp. NBC_01327]
MSTHDTLAGANYEGRKALATSKIKKFQQLLSAELSPALADQGFLPGSAPRGMEGLWFASKSPSLPHATAAVKVVVESRRDWLGMSAYAHLTSDAVAEIVRNMPDPARAADSSDDSPYLGSIELVGFASFIKPAPAGEFLLVNPSSVPRAADWFLQCVRGPVAEWFLQRDSVSKLVDLAKFPTAAAVDRKSPSSMRLRATVILCALEGRLADAAGLMRWYLTEGRFDGLDSPEQASAFDIALGQQFPGYAEARKMMD